MLTPFAIPPLAVGTLIALLGIFVVFWERASRVSRVFCLLTFSVALWLCSYAANYNTSDPQAAFEWIRRAQIGVSFIPSFVFFFTVLVTRQNQLQGYAKACFLISAFFCGFDLWKNKVLIGTYHYDWGFYGRYGSWGYPFLFFFGVLLIGSLLLLFNSYRKAQSERERARLRLLLWAFFFGDLASVDFLPAFGIPLYPVGNLCVGLFIIMTAFAIIRYHLVGITPAYAANQILKTMQSGVLVSDLDGIVRLANHSVCEILGYAESEILGLPIAAIASWPQEKEFLNYLMIWKTKKGARIRVSVSASPLRDKNQNPVGTVYAATDIRQIMETEEALRTSEQRFRLLIETARDAIITSNIEGNITSFNPEAENIFGCRAAEVLGKPLTILMPERFRKNHVEGLRRLRVTGEGRLLGKTIELVGLRKDGSEFPLELSLSSWRSNEGHFVTAIIRDVTERKRSQETLRQRETLEMKSHFISMASHELRTPLTALKMGLDILNTGKAGKVTEPQKEWLDMAWRNADRLAHLIDQVLDFQKLEAGRSQFHLEENNLNDLIREIKMNLLPLAEAKHLEFLLGLDENLPRAYFDRDRIGQVLTNLVGNAIKYTERGKITVRSICKTGAVQVAVSDTGVGLRPEDMPKLFSFFSEINSEHQKKVGGTGLGLAIAKKIIEQHGGRIWADSDYGKGSTFFFELSADMAQKSKTLNPAG